MMLGGTRLRDMIRNVRTCKTAAEERAVIAKECANLRTAFKENDVDYRHRNVAKLMFIHMLGYPTHFGQMECLKLIASPGFPEKRIGYLGLMVLLDERQEVLMLVTNSLKNDLNHSNQFICGLALCALGNICSSEMARDLAPEVERLLNSNNSYIRKKAALCSVRILRKVPDLADYLLPAASGLLQDKHHGVLLGGASLALQMCHVHPPALEHYRKHTATLVRILKNLVVSGYAPEYDVSGVTDPFLQIRVLRLLRAIGHGDAEASDVMSDILAQVATNTEASKNTGNAILYEAVQTIFGIEAVGGLRVLAVNILGRFLGNRDNNIRYVALNTLIKVVGIDRQAVQRHRGTILDCIKDSDLSIRRRALELLFALVNESNVAALTQELLLSLRSADGEFKADLTAKICALMQRFAPNKMYHLEILLQVIVEAGEYVTDDVIRFLVVMLANAPELQGFAVRSFFRAFQQWQGQESLGLLAAWCIGEYGEMLTAGTNPLPGETATQVPESTVLSLLEATLKDHRCSAALKAHILTAFLKLSVRFPASKDRILPLVSAYRHSLLLELQQRSVEFSSLLSRHPNLIPTLVDKMPALDEAAYRAKKADLERASASASGPTPPSSASLGPTLSSAPAAAAAPMLADLLDLSVDDSVAPAAAAAAGGAVSRAGAAAGLLDLLGGGPTPPPAAPSAAPPPPHGLLDLLSLSDGPPQPTPPPAASAFDPLAALSAAPTHTAGAAAASAAAAGASLASAPLDPFAAPTGEGGAGAAAVPSSWPFISAFESNGLSVRFAFAKEPLSPQATVITATFSNSSATPFTDFVFQAAVPKFMQLQLEAASGAELPAFGAGSVTQVMRVSNSLHGQKPLAMRLRISYRLAGQQEVQEQAQVSNFPPGL